MILSPTPETHVPPSATLIPMGTLVHGYGAAGFEIDDRKLSHIKVVVSLKLDRGESFYLSWVLPPTEGTGRVSLWMSRDTPVQFRFSEGERPTFNRQWIEYMMSTSFGPRGVIVVDEDDANVGTPMPVGLI